MCLDIALEAPLDCTLEKGIANARIVIIFMSISESHEKSTTLLTNYTPYEVDHFKQSLASACQFVG